MPGASAVWSSLGPPPKGALSFSSSSPSPGELQRHAPNRRQLLSRRGEFKLQANDVRYLVPDTASQSSPSKPLSASM